MDKKSLIILLVSFGVLMAWYPLTNRLFPPHELPPQTNTVTRVTNTVAGSNAATIGALTNAPALVATTNAPSSALATAGPEETVILESEDVRYTFTSHGGGIKLVELKEYPEAVGCFGRKPEDTNGVASLNTSAPLPAFALIEDESLTAPKPYNLSRQGDTVRAESDLGNGLHVIKEFTLSTNYLLKATVRYENRTAEPLRIPERQLIIGTATPMGYRDESISLGIEWFNGDKAEKITAAWFDNKTLGCFPGTPRSTYMAGDSNVVWAAVHNQFFTMIAVPEHPADQVIGRRINLPMPTKAEMADDPAAVGNPYGFQTAFFQPAAALPANSFIQQNYQLFAGPKEYKTLSRLPKDMDRVMGFGFFGFVAKALLLSMNGLHSLGIAYGVAIIVITVIIKLLFWPLTQASTRSMKRMSALQPQMKALQEKYKDDPKKMNMKLMEFMKEHKVSPLGGCLPLLLQIPVFFGFYQMLQSAIELRGADFLWACDLSQPDTIFWIGSFAVNPLPLLMGATMLWQARLTPASPGMDPAQQKIMRYMPLMMVVFLYNFSAGLTLYWTVQNLLSIAQMKLTKTKEEPKPTLPSGRPTTPAKQLPPKKKK